MCVIIHRQPNTVIPYEMLESACLVNADGMGLVAYDRGKMEMRKVFDKAGNDPKILQKFLEDAKDLHVYAHLRYRTKGNTDKDNVHPFGVLKSSKHGADVQFMHNGTLSDFGTANDCDSKHFVKTFLTPLAEKFLRAVEPDVLIHDKIFLEILNKYAGKSSVFLLSDNYGNHQIVNYDNGKEYEGWWASNEYSFNRTHRTPVVYSGGYGKGYANYSEGSYYRDGEWSNTRRSVQTPGKTVVTLPPLPPKGTESKGYTTPPFDDPIPFDTKETEVKEVAKKAPISPTLPGRVRFIEVAEMGCLSEIVQLSRTHIEDLVEEFPEHAVLLIMDLVKELYDRDMEYDAYAEEAA